MKRGSKATTSQAASGRRLTLRLRIALTTAALIAATGVLVLGSVYVYMRFAPDYTLVPQPSSTTAYETKPTVGASVSPTAPSATASPSETAGKPQPSASKKADPAPSKKVPINTVPEVFSTLLTISVITLAGMTILGALVAWLVAGLLLTPLRRLSNEVAATSADTLGSPLEEAGPNDEVLALTKSVNAMKARLNATFQTQRRFASNASHELKTPLITSQALIDVALDDMGEPDSDAAQPIRPVLQQLRGLTHQSLITLDALLDLAEATSVPLQRSPVDLSKVVAAVAEQFAPLAAADQVTLTCDLDKSGHDVTDESQPAGDVWVDGDESLLTVLVRNLVANAIQHNVPGGKASAWLSADDSGAVLRVENDGATLTTEQASQLAEPFYRVGGRLNVTQDRGHGLGLPLAKAVAEAHGGHLDLTPRPDGGLAVEVWLPSGAEI